MPTTPPLPSLRTVIFSKDRPWQLQEYLLSFLYYIRLTPEDEIETVEVSPLSPSISMNTTTPIPVSSSSSSFLLSLHILILYRSTSLRYDQAYHYVQTFINTRIRNHRYAPYLSCTWVKEGDFGTDFALLLCNHHPQQQQQHKSKNYSNLQEPLCPSTSSTTSTSPTTPTPRKLLPSLSPYDTVLLSVDDGLWINPIPLYAGFNSLWMRSSLLPSPSTSSSSSSSATVSSLSVNSTPVPVLPHNTNSNPDTVVSPLSSLTTTTTPTTSPTTIPMFIPSSILGIQYKLHPGIVYSHPADSLCTVPPLYRYNNDGYHDTLFGSLRKNGTTETIPSLSHRSTVSSYAQPFYYYYAPETCACTKDWNYVMDLCGTLYRATDLYRLCQSIIEEELTTYYNNNHQQYPFHHTKYDSLSSPVSSTVYRNNISNLSTPVEKDTHGSSDVSSSSSSSLPPSPILSTVNTFNSFIPTTDLPIKGLSHPNRLEIALNAQWKNCRKHSLSSSSSSSSLPTMINDSPLHRFFQQHSLYRLFTSNLASLSSDTVEHNLHFPPSLKPYLMLVPSIPTLVVITINRVQDIYHTPIYSSIAPTTTATSTSSSSSSLQISSSSTINNIAPNNITLDQSIYTELFSSTIDFPPFFSSSSSDEGQLKEKPVSNSFEQPSLSVIFPSLKAYIQQMLYTYTVPSNGTTDTTFFPHTNGVRAYDHTTNRFPPSTNESRSQSSQSSPLSLSPSSILFNLDNPLSLLPLIEINYYNNYKDTDNTSASISSSSSFSVHYNYDWYTSRARLLPWSSVHISDFILSSTETYSSLPAVSISSPFSTESSSSLTSTSITRPFTSSSPSTYPDAIPSNPSSLPLIPALPIPDRSYVHVLLPVHNSEQFIQDTLLSLTNQMYPYWHIIIINDQCTDKTLTFIHNWCTKYHYPTINNPIYPYTYPSYITSKNSSTFPSRLVSIISTGTSFSITHNPSVSSPKGITYALNTGLAYIYHFLDQCISILSLDKQFIARMDSDDINLPERFRIQTERFYSFPHTDILGTFIETFSSTDSLTIPPHPFHSDMSTMSTLYGTKGWKPSKQRIVPLPSSLSFVLVRWQFWFGCGIVHPTVMFRASLFWSTYKQYISSYLNTLSTDNPLTVTENTLRSSPWIFPLYPEDYPHAEDYGLWMRLMYPTPISVSASSTLSVYHSRPVQIGNVNQVLLYLRKHGQNISSQYSSVQKESTIRIVQTSIRSALGRLRNCSSSLLFVPSLIDANSSLLLSDTTLPIHICRTIDQILSLSALLGSSPFYTELVTLVKQGLNNFTTTSGSSGGTIPFRTTNDTDNSGINIPVIPYESSSFDTGYQRLLGLLTTDTIIDILINGSKAVTNLTTTTITTTATLAAIYGTILLLHCLEQEIYYFMNHTEVNSVHSYTLPLNGSSLLPSPASSLTISSSYSTLRKYIYEDTTNRIGELSMITNKYFSQTIEAQAFMIIWLHRKQKGLVYGG